MDFTQTLLNAQSPDIATRQLAERTLSEAEVSNPAMFLHALCVELATEEKPPLARQLAGLVLKNALTAKEETRRVEIVKKWLSLDVNVKAQIKLGILKTLASPSEARHTAAQVISKVALIELPKNMWPELVHQLLNNMQATDDNLKQATLEAIGYVAEEIDPEVLKVQANEILTAVCKGIKDPNNEIKLAGCNALFNALEFVKQNFEKEVERNYIMQVVCEAAVSTDNRVKVASMECLVRVASLYYDKLVPYMQKIFNITLEAIKNAEEPVAQQAVEFWSTICDEEMYLLEEAEEAVENKLPPPQCHNFIRGAMKYLIPLLTETLTRQEDDPEEDSWNVAMAAGTCLALVATTVKDEVVSFVMPFVQQHINSENWKFREAATLAFGAILEGPRGYLSQLISQAIPVLMQHMNDPVVHVKDTTAWTIGRVCQLHAHTVSQYLAPLVQVLAEHLADSPKVAANVCWALHNLAMAYEDDQDKQTSALSPFFRDVVQRLLQATERSDADESNLRCSAYEAINVIIQTGAKDTIPLTTAALPLFVNSLEKTFQMQIISSDDREQQTELQSLLCGVLQVITQKLGSDIKPYADKIMTLYLQVLNFKSASVHEEALMGVGAIANAVEADFEKYMPHFRPYLVLGLKNHEEHQVCAVSVGVVGDIARAMGPKLAPYCDEIVSILLQNLQNPNLNRDVKPPILSSFGDVAMAISGEFAKYLNIVMNMLNQAAATSAPDANDYDMVDYVNQLREGIFEAYTGIIQGMRSDNSADHIFPFVMNIVSFVGFVSQDQNRSDSVTRLALGVLGDLVHAYGDKVRPQLQQQAFVKQLITECLNSDNSASQDVARWAKERIYKN